MWLFRLLVNLILSQAVQLVLRVVSAVVVRMVDKHRVEMDMVLRERRRDWVKFLDGNFSFFFFFFFKFYRLSKKPALINVFEFVISAKINWLKFD